VEFEGKIKLLEKEIFILANEEFNIGSPKQLGEVLFEHMGIQGGKKTKTGNYTTDSDALEGLMEQGHSIAGKVLEWRSFSKLMNTYTLALVKEINDNTARVHTTFNQNTTTTGRLSSTAPNLQNIPIRTEEGRRIRQAFISEQGKTLIGIDYSQIELRLLAHVANIPVLIKAFKEGKDIHAATASQVFGVDIDKVDSELRRRAKTVNFGIIYGQGAFGLAAQLGIARGEAKTLIEKYFAQYPGIKKYMDDTIIEAHEKGYVSTLWGRKIHLPGINDKNGAVRSFNERAAINAPLQGTAADIIKRAMILIDKELANSRSTKLLLQIHDELIIEADSSEAEKIAERCKQLMEQVITLSVPLIADSRIGKNWGEIH
jgi:DNA polymerase-1